MKRILFIIAFVLTLLTMPTQSIVSRAASTSYDVDGYLQLAGDVLNWQDFIATNQWMSENGQGDYVVFEGETEWAHDTASYTFAQAGQVSISQLITQGVIVPTRNHTVNVYYALDGGYYGFEFLGEITVVAIPDYISTWQGVVNNAYANYIVSYHNRPARSAILADLKAFDEEDGDVTLSIVETTSTAEKSAYDTLSRHLDTYHLTFRATDSHNNVADITIRISVIDTVAPIIHGPENTVTLLNANETITAIVNRVWSTTDTYDIAPILSVIADDYTSSHDVVTSVGHQVTLQATDQFGNSSTKTVRIIVEDNIAPTITGTATYTKGSQAPLSLTTIQSVLVVQDVGTSATLFVSYDGYTSRSTTPGTYKIHFYAKDTANNRSPDFIVSVTVTDDQAPIFFVDGMDYQVTPGNTYTMTQLLFVLESNGTILSSTYTYDVVLDEYTANAHTAGDYKIVLNIHFDDGSSKQLEMNMKVPEIAVEVEPTVWDTVWSSITNFFDGLWHFLFS